MAWVLCHTALRPTNAFAKYRQKASKDRPDRTNSDSIFSSARALNSIPLKKFLAYPLISNVAIKHTACEQKAPETNGTLFKYGVLVAKRLHRTAGQAQFSRYDNQTSVEAVAICNPRYKNFY
jgi:hypothetical protein